MSELVYCLSQKQEIANFILKKNNKNIISANISKFVIKVNLLLPKTNFYRIQNLISS